MRKSLLAIVTATVMSVSFVASAASLEAEMKVLAKNFEVVTTTADATEFVKALQEMRGAAEAASKITPDKLSGKAEDSKEMQEYRQGYADLIAKIDEAIKQAEAKDMTAAKATAEGLAEIRNANHKLFR